MTGTELDGLIGTLQQLGYGADAESLRFRNQATRMFSEQASQFFLGKSSLFTPVEYADNNALRAEFTQKVLDKDAAQVKAIWSKLVFTGKAVAPREYASSAEVKRAVATDVNAIGHVEKSAVDDSVKAILSVP